MRSEIYIQSAPNNSNETYTFMQARRKWGGLGSLAPPIFGQTVNPISTRVADYAHHSNTSPPGFLDLATALPYVYLREIEQSLCLPMYLQTSYQSRYPDMCICEFQVMFLTVNKFSFYVCISSNLISIISNTYHSRF